MTDVRAPEGDDRQDGLNNQVKPPPMPILFWVIAGALAAGLATYLLLLILFKIEEANNGGPDCGGECINNNAGLVFVFWVPVAAAAGAALGFALGKHRRAVTSDDDDQQSKPESSN